MNLQYSGDKHRVDLASIYGRSLRITRTAVCSIWALIRMVRLTLVNRYSGSVIIGANGPVVSLTSYGKRIPTVHFAIESIGRGRVLPSRIILWLDEKPVFDNPPAALRRLQMRGLEIRLSRNYGPHTKYYPYIEQESSFGVPLVTADDDHLYPRYWLAGLVRAYDTDPSFVHCYRARVIKLSEDGFVEYKKWKLCRSTEPSYRHLALGVSGVIYPPKLLAVLKQAGDGFEKRCPHTDDLWLHVHALRSGFCAKQIQARAREFPSILSTQHVGLYRKNVKFGDGNDLNLKTTYTPADISALRAESQTDNLTREVFVAVN